MKHSLAIVVLSLFFGPGSVLAQEAITAPITVRLMTHGDGNIAIVAKEEKMSVIVKIVDAVGKVLADKNESASEIAEYTETIVKRNGVKPASKLERDYTKAQLKKGAATEDSPLQGKKIVIERKAGNKYEYTIKGGDRVAAAAEAILAKEFISITDDTPDLDVLMSPKQLVKPGDSWKLDMGPIVNEISKNAMAEFDAAKATGTGVLQKTYKKDGKLNGEMKFTMEIPVKTIGEGPAQIVFAAGTKAVMEVRFDICIDGSSAAGTLSQTMRLTGTGTIAQIPGAIVTVTFTGQSNVSKRDPSSK